MSHPDQERIICPAMKIIAIQSSTKSYFVAAKLGVIFHQILLTFCKLHHDMIPYDLDQKSTPHCKFTCGDGVLVLF